MAEDPLRGRRCIATRSQPSTSHASSSLNRASRSMSFKAKSITNELENTRQKRVMHGKRGPRKSSNLRFRLYTVSERSPVCILPLSKHQSARKYAPDPRSTQPRPSVGCPLRRRLLRRSSAPLAEVHLLSSRRRLRRRTSRPPTAKRPAQTTSLKQRGICSRRYSHRQQPFCGIWHPSVDEDIGSRLKNTARAYAEDHVGRAKRGRAILDGMIGGSAWKTPRE